MTDSYDGGRPAHPSFIVGFLTKVLMLALTIVIVWSVYAYLHAYRLDWLGWWYVKLQPATLELYSLVETYFPEDVKYKVRGAISDDLGPRSLFLLLLSAAVELTLYTLFRLIQAIFASALSPMRA